MFFCFLYIIYFYLFLCFRTFLCNFIHFSDYCNLLFKCENAVSYTGHKNCVQCTVRTVYTRYWIICRLTQVQYNKIV